MRSSPNALLLALVVAACGDNDPGTACDRSALNYDTFGEPYVADWCRGCHSADLSPAMRQGAPVAVNFDTLDDVRAQLQMVEYVTSNELMPPAGGPTDDERALMMQWLTCGAR
jgi:uncharacterized membrane protein